MKLKPATWETIRDVELAIGHLRRARDQLKAADCPQALERVRMTLKSAEGAHRHVLRRALHTATKGKPT